MKFTVNMYILYIVIIACIIMLAFEDMISTIIYGMLSAVSIGYYMLLSKDAKKRNRETQSDIRDVSEAR